MANDGQPSPPPYSAQVAVRTNEVEDLERGGSVAGPQNQNRRAALPPGANKSTKSRCTKRAMCARICSISLFLTAVGAYIWLKTVEKYYPEWFCAQPLYVRDVAKTPSGAMFFAFLFQCFLELCFAAIPPWSACRNHAMNILIITTSLTAGVLIAPAFACQVKCE